MFEKIKSKVQTEFNALLLANSGLFKVDLEKNVLFQAYLDALPEEERQPHNCHCCRHFLNNYGGVVAIMDGAVKTLWDFEVESPYAAVPAALRKLVEAAPIAGVFVSSEANLGTDSNPQRLASGEVIRWTHFYAKLPADRLLRRGVSVDAAVGRSVTSKQVFERALKELTVESTETVLELIAQNSLYRGSEFKTLLERFLVHQKKVVGLSDEAISLYAWENTNTNTADASGIRNTVIGTLLVDLSEGRELDSAVASYEQKVAPTNYRRPTALVTKGMLEKAERDIAELGLERSLYRRHATVDDIPVNEVLFVNRSVSEGGLFDALKDDVRVDAKTFSKVEEVSIDRFVSEVLPTATGLEILLENKHAGNFVNLTAPRYSDSHGLFSWKNGIAWAYKDGVADSVKERVKKAGGKVEGELRISLDWYNYDDLDLHVIEPNKNEIWFRSKRSSKGYGGLDVDMNAGGGTTREPVENVIFDTEFGTLEGPYSVVVHNYRKRESVDTGFGLEIECKGEVFSFSSAESPRDSSSILAATFTYSRKDGVTVTSALCSKSPASKEIYGLSTHKFHKVSMVLPSPNHWEGERSGNRHTFFIVDKARTDTDIRGFFNEFLDSSLRDHRKVFELLGSKVKVAPDGEQLAGLGFSSTQHAEVICRVTGAFTRVIKIKF